MFGVFESQEFKMQVTVGLVFWYIAFCFDQIYIKHTISHLQLTIWTNVAYTNTIASILAGPFAYNEFRSGLITFPGESIWLLVSSCVLGVCMAYFSFAARQVFSATTYTMMGNACKVGSIAGNHVLWTQHASVPGLLCVLVVLASSYLYDESARKGSSPAPTPAEPEISTADAAVADADSVDLVEGNRDLSTRIAE